MTTGQTEEPVKATPEERRAIRKRRKLEALCNTYLESLHCTLWGENFNVIHPSGRAEAVRWLADTLEGLASVDDGGDGNG